MEKFEYFNPTRIIFGKGTIAQLSQQLPAGASVLMVYGGGSIKRNGVYDQVMAALKDFPVVEFGGIEANPDVDTLRKAIELGKEHQVDWVLAVGGGSVIDGAKLVAAAIPRDDVDPWDIVTGKVTPKAGEVLPLATVLTLPATGSEMNPTSVISRRATNEKLAWRDETAYPVVSILDPTTTFSLPENQIRNGVVDAYIHVMEQYITYPVHGCLQDRQAEGILLTLQEVGEKALQLPPDEDARASMMWAATNALNKLICKGVPEDWATHGIGHEITALYDLAHAETLAAIMPHLLWNRRAGKRNKLIQYAHRVWQLEGDDEDVIRAAIDKMVAFFHKLGMPTTLTAYGIDPDEAAERISQRLADRNVVLGERQDVTPEVVAEIVRMSR